ncbi:MAG: phosphotransferase [Chloroflexota bacterium]
MKPFDQLTYQGKLRRIRVLANDILSQYPIKVDRLELIGDYTNTLYRVRTSDGQQYALRVARPGWRDIAAAESEVLWLDALAADTDIPVPKIIRNKANNGVVIGQLDGLPEPRHAMLMTWQPGIVLGKRLTETNLEKMGALFAQLHLHSAGWQLPQGFRENCYDHIFAQGEKDVLFADEHLSAYTPSGLKTLRQMYERVQAAYEYLTADDLQVIHADLWHDNIKVHQGILYPFDFEDTIRGYRIYDIATAMLDLYEVMDLARYERLLAAFRRGYEQNLAWPDGDLVLFQIGNILKRINYIARFETKWLAGDAAFYGDLFERYLTHGKLIPPLRPG